MKKYKINSWNADIEEIEIERETDKCVFLRWSHGNRIHKEAKRSGYDQYFDTLKEAREYLIQRTENTVKNLKRSLDIEEDRLRRLRQQSSI